MEVQVEPKNETTVGEIVKANETQPRGRQDAVVVTPENFNAYVDERMGVTPNPDPEAQAKAAKERLDAEKKAKDAKKPEAQDVETEEGVAEHLPKDKKGKLNERFSELTAKRKEAEERAAKKEAEAKAEREAREKYEAEAKALRDKYEPVKTEPDPEPQVSQFANVEEYSKALKEWTADNTRREDAKKAEAKAAQEAQEKVVREWNERQAAYRKEHPDYDEKISKSGVKVSDQVRDAILDSEVGPAILEHLADNPDEADRIGKLTVAQALKAVGRLETQFIKSEKTAPQGETKTPVAEISRAPAPITPLKASGNPVDTVTSGTQEWHGTFEEYKAKRLAGKIR